VHIVRSGQAEQTGQASSGSALAELVKGLAMRTARQLRGLAPSRACKSGEPSARVVTDSSRSALWFRLKIVTVQLEMALSR
jgi:hypothetical protein